MTRPLAIGRCCLSRRLTLVSNSVRFLETAPSFYPRTSLSTTTGKEALQRVHTSPKSQGRSVLSERYRIDTCTGTSLVKLPARLSPRLTRFSPSMSQARSSSTNAPKGDNAGSTKKSTQRASCDYSDEHADDSDYSHSHSIFHSHSHDADDDHTHGAEQIVHVLEGKGTSSVAWCTVLAQHA